MLAMKDYCNYNRVINRALQALLQHFFVQKNVFEQLFPKNKNKKTKINVAKLTTVSAQQMKIFNKWIFSRNILKRKTLPKTFY